MCDHGCDGCPFNFFSEQSEQIQNYGCLPTPHDIKRIYEELDGVWGCHETSKEDGNLKACTGFINWMKENGSPVKINGKEVVDYSIWSKEPEYFRLKNLEM